MALSWNPAVLALILILAVLYHILTGPLRSRWRSSIEPPRLTQQLSFFSALVLYFLCLGSPLNIWATQDLYSAHMIQVALLTLAVPPLVYRGLPKGLLEAWYAVPMLRRIVRTVGHPLLALLLFNMVMWAWQYPPLLDWTLRFNVPYTIGALLAMVTAFFLWWPLYAPGSLTSTPGKKSQGARQLLSPALAGPLNPEAQMIYWFLNFDLMMPPTIYVIDTSSPFYTVYQSMPHLFGLSSLADQQLGGIIMGLSMTSAYAIAFARAFSHYDMSSWYA